MENLRGVLFSQDGISAQVSESGDVIAFGGPGAFRWEGLLHVVTTDPKRPISTKHKDAGEHRPYVGKDECDFRVESPKLAYLGYATDFVKFGSSDTVYIAVGGPRYACLVGLVSSFCYRSSWFLLVYETDNKKQNRQTDKLLGRETNRLLLVASTFHFVNLL
jgi:hypothetical protein